MVGTLQQPDSIAEHEAPVVVDIRPLLQRLWPDPYANQVTAKEIADAIALIFTNELSPVQTGSLLTALHFTGWDRKADVLAAASAAMRNASAPIDFKKLNEVVERKARREGRYNGGLVSFSNSSHRRATLTCCSSAISLVLEVTHITLSTSQPHLQFLLPHCYKWESMVTGHQRQSPGQQIC